MKSVYLMGDGVLGVCKTTPQPRGTNSFTVQNVPQAIDLTCLLRLFAEVPSRFDLL